MSGAPPILEVENLSRSYQTAGHPPLPVLRGVSFALSAQTTCAIVGPSGSGKTTLLGLCAGLDLPTAGRVRLVGQDLAAVGEEGRSRLRREAVGFVFQNFQLLPTLTALENVLLPLELLGRGGSTSRAQAADWLQRTGLGDRLDHYPVQLSGGEQQRVALARAFVHGPRILFADEPTGNLDSANAALLEGLLFDLNRVAGTTLVLVTHNPDLAARCQRRLRLQAGELREDSGPAAAGN